MMTDFYRIIFFVGILISFSTCSISPVEENDSISFLDINSAKAAIAEDRTENFFDEIQLKDIQLQLKKDTVLSLPKARELYRNTLRENVMEFNPKDQERLNRIFNEIETVIEKINPDILSEKIRLIKINPFLYGEGVFYTRDNAIVIPSDMLDEFNHDLLKQIMIHEIFHIYSRNNRKEKREELYALIHFKKMKEDLVIPKAIQEKILLNPDGLEMEWYIECQIDTSRQRLMPLLIANEHSSSDFYFDNLELRFFPLSGIEQPQIKEGIYYRESDLTDFYEQITRNTDYIIHPDEILAENFVLAILSQENPAILNGLSGEGRRLVENLLDLLRGND